MKTRRQSQDKEGQGKPRRRSRLWPRLLAAVLAPVVFLLATEGLLRIVGFGRSAGFFIPWTSAGGTVHVTSQHYCEHFVPKELSRAPETSVLGKKTVSTVRVFVLGGSAAFGDPDAAYGFCRQLEVLLNGHSDMASFEVINAAVTAMNSHVARRIARDCAEYEPDVFVVYMGNNEVIGPYGPPTLPATVYASRGFIDLCIWTRKQTRLGQLMRRGVEALRVTDRAPQRWMGMEAFLATQMARDDPRMASCYRHFEANLRDIVRTAHAAGAATILCTVPTNIRSCAPFGSMHRAGMTEAERTEWDRLFAEGRALEGSGHFAAALERYEQAGAIDETHATLAFCRARCLLALDKPDEAKGLLVEARDLDTLRFRADSSIDEAIRKVAGDLAGRRAWLCDVEGYLAARSRGGLLGDDLLADHVHLNFRGNFLAARAVMEQIGQVVVRAQLAASTLTEDELMTLCRQRLLYDDSEAYRLGMVMYRRKTLSPFAGQIDHDSELARLRRDLITVYSHIKDRSEPESWYVDAVERAPLDAYLNVRYGEYLLSQGRLGEAIRRYQEVLTVQPFSRGVRVGLAQALASGGMEDEAIDVFTEGYVPDAMTRRDALLMLGTYYVTKGKIAEAREVYQELNRIDPDDLDVLINLAAGASHAGDSAAVKRYLDRALKLAPESAQAMINMGNYYAKQARPDEAQQWFAKAVATDPHDYLAQIGLGIQSIRLGQIDKGLAHVKAAVILKPDFAEGYAILANACEKLNRPEDARRYAELRDLFLSPAAKRPVEVE